MAKTPRVVNLALVGVLIAAAAGMAQAEGTINYRLAIDDVVASDHVKVLGSTIKVTIEANVPDMPLTGGGYGGLIQYAINLSDSTGTGGGSSLLPQVFGGYWDFTAQTPFTNVLGGDADLGGYDVYDLTGGPPFGKEELYKSSVGAGPGVWTSVGYGYFTYSSGTVVLTLEPRPLAAQLVWGDSGMESPTLTNGYSTTITPEPATLGLLALGLGAVALRKRRR
jgi:hypothetical protein